jgi:hypothetical protein
MKNEHTVGHSHGVAYTGAIGLPNPSMGVIGGVLHPGVAGIGQERIDAALAAYRQERDAKYPSAPVLLKKAADHMTERAKQYDKPEGERSMGKAVQAFNAITGRDLTEPEGWLLLQVLKDVRLFQRPGYHADSAEDCIAYAALKAEAKAREAQS